MTNFYNFLEETEPYFPLTLSTLFHHRYCPSILLLQRFSSALRRETSLADRPFREHRSNAVTTHSHPCSSTIRTRPSWPDIDTYHVRGSVDEHTERHSPSARPEKSRSCRTNSTRHSGSHSPRRSVRYGGGCSGENVGEEGRRGRGWVRGVLLPP